MRLAANVYKQDIGQPLLDTLTAAAGEAVRRRSPSGTYRFTHILNPYSPPDDLADRTQALTFATQKTAMAATRHRVEVVAVAYPDDEAYARRFFDRTARIGRSVLDVHDGFQVPRRLPLLFDILAAGVGAGGEGEYIVLTNTDIGLMPGFYDLLAALLGLGFDVLTINRRMVAREYPLDPAWAPLIAADFGGPHEGFDCFVFPRALFGRFVRSDSCVAAAGVMRSLLYNLVAFSRNMLMLTDVHATWHVGHDLAWDRPELQDYIVYNWDQARRVLDALAPEHGARLGDFCRNHGERLRL